MDYKLKPDFDKMPPEVREMYEWVEATSKEWDEIMRGAFNQI